MSSSSADALVLLPLVASVSLMLGVSAAMALVILVAMLGVDLLIRRLAGNGP